MKGYEETKGKKPVNVAGHKTRIKTWEAMRSRLSTRQLVLLPPDNSVQFLIPFSSGFFPFFRTMNLFAEILLSSRRLFKERRKWQ